MSSKPNKAIYADENALFSVRDDIRHEDIAANELLIETSYTGVNPADIRHSTLLGIRSTVVGYDFSGRVLKAPSGSKFKEGDVVAGYTPSGMGRPTKYGAHQSYLVVPEDDAFKVPSNLPAAHAAALTVVVMTASDVIFNLFKFPMPTSPGNFTGPILIWGASSSVGISAVQLAKASGCKNIFVTASSSRHGVLKSLGATHTFDYSTPTIVADIVSAVEALGQGPITHALDAVGTMGSPSSSDLVSQCVGESAALSSVILRPDGKFRMPVATTKDPWRIQPPGAPGPIDIPARPDDHKKAWEALNWAVDNYGKRFELPSVSVLDITAEKAIEELWNVAEGKRGFGKIVFSHPLK